MGWRRWTVAIALCAGVLGAGAPAWAEPSPRALALAQRYVKAMHMDMQLATMMDGIVPSMVEGIAKGRGETLTAEVKVMLGKVSSEAVVAMTPKFVEAMIPVVAETFSEAELEAAVAYFETPAAQSMIAKTPALAAKSAQAVAPLMPAFRAELEARLCKEVGCDR